ncbi:MAG: hypothetical protein JWM11_415 [Planctomycetaceae bacterium]|nr:hypothetical protein [Planctomycetaceae bacterium]
MKLNIGCGGERLGDFINIDVNPDCKVDLVMDLPRDSLTERFGENSVDEIFSCHALEHMAPFLPLVLDMWRVSKPGAVWNIEVPHRDYEIGNPYHLTQFTEWTFRFFEPTPRFRCGRHLIMRGTASEMHPIKLEEIEQQLIGDSIKLKLRVVK